MPKVAIIGTTIWGSTLGVALARKGVQVRLWARTEREADELKKAGSNLPLSNSEFPQQLSACG